MCVKFVMFVPAMAVLMVVVRHAHGVLGRTTRARLVHYTCKNAPATSATEAGMRDAPAFA
ncbi:MAG: hypothetical protein JNL83_34645 [Myxococcales bacterium]|nr:hypothetical protein [Myxococcales bacterium]